VHRTLDGGLPDLPPEVELAVYRIAQEAVTNVVRHSGASEAGVSLTCTGDQVVLCVTDNGRGLPAGVREGGGLTGIRERAMLIGGDLEITSAAGGGVGVTVRLPVRRGDACRPR
jgi:two-component system, NarL family, sensor histidine kinase UhpB